MGEHGRNGSRRVLFMTSPCISVRRILAEAWEPLFTRRRGLYIDRYRYRYQFRFDLFPEIYSSRGSLSTK
jgi:hypothetical protein